ncbi:MAG TPA: MFS transporter [Pseudonocardiaceae bacterium]|jgi:MFS family permease|nr:MFS transporter [Pseudonocardiaceae bacterium]
MTHIAQEPQAIDPDTAADGKADPPLSRNRAFQLLWGSQFLSTIGTRTSRLSYPLLVLAVLGSPADASLVSAALTLPMPLLYLLAGALVDRTGHKRVLLLCEGVRALALGSVAVAIFLRSVSLWQLIVVAFVEGSCFVFFQLAEAALVPRVVPGGQLASAIAANQARTSGAELVGQPLGGLLFGLGWAVPFLADAASYLASFIALLGLRIPARVMSGAEVRPVGRRGLAHDLLAGLRWFARQREAIALAVVIGLVNLLFAALPLVMIVRARDSGSNPEAIGWMFAMLSCGAIIGAAAAPWLSRRVNRRLYLCLSPWFWSLCVLALSASSRPLLLGGIVGVAMLAAPTFNVITSSYWYRVTPDELQARSQSVLRLITWGALPLGSLTAGWLTRWPTSQAILVLALAMAIVATGMLGVSVVLRKATALSPATSQAMWS